MIKYYCDNCKKEVDKFDIQNFGLKKFELCEKCNKRFLLSRIDIEKMINEEREKCDFIIEQNIEKILTKNNLEGVNELW